MFKHFQNNKNLTLTIFGVIVLFPVIVPWLSNLTVYLYYKFIMRGSLHTPETMAQIGDHFGGTTAPYIGLLACILTFCAFYAQIQANRDVQKQFLIQQFESQYFEMIRLHKENINEMKISGYTYHTQTTLEKDGNNNVRQTYTRSETERHLEGRKVFVSMVKELKVALNVCRAFNLDNIFTPEEMQEFAYRIFFFGVDSKLLNNINFDQSRQKLIRDYLRDIRKQHAESSSGLNTFELNGTKINLHIKYKPFSGHESRLGHYYRHLFAVVNFVVDKHENSKLFDYVQCRDYLKILRAQMSNDEQLLLYYNYICAFGKRWENDVNNFFSHYRLLHNLPIDRVEIVESPRKHFRKQILKIHKNDSTQEMFEWGDFDKENPKPENLH